MLRLAWCLLCTAAIVPARGEQARPAFARGLRAVGNGRGGVYVHVVLPVQHVRGGVCAPRHDMIVAYSLNRRRKQGYKFQPRAKAPAFELFILMRAAACMAS
jgi:hypothetical protein